MPVPRDFLGQGGQYLFVQRPYLAEMRVVLKERGALFFGQQVDLGVRIAPFEQLDGRRGEHHIADLPELADKDALGRKGGEIDDHYSAPTSSAMRRHMDALFSVYRWMPGSAVVQQGADLLHGKLEARFAYGFRAALGIGFLKGEIELARDVRAAQGERAPGWIRGSGWAGCRG